MVNVVVVAVIDLYFQIVEIPFAYKWIEAIIFLEKIAFVFVVFPICYDGTV